MSLLKIEEPEDSKAGRFSFGEHALWRLGFRPFYLLAAVFAVLSVPLWVAQYFGLIHAPHVNLFWHMHEMVYGFALAVVIGFLFTAMRNWTGLWTPRKQHLAALAGLWLLGRLAMLCAPPIWAAIIDLTFLPLATWPMFRVLQRSGNKRNMFLVLILSLLWVVDLAFHAAVNGVLGMSPIAIMQAAILLVVMIASLIGARVMPMFTANGAPGTKPVVNAARDRITVVLTVLASAAWIFGLPAKLTAAICLAAAISIAIRLAGWQPHRTVRVPLLWILHLAYGWIPIGFLLLSLTALGLVPSSAAFHALAIGAIAGLILGMITRTTLGHTGRMLKAGAAETIMYALIQIGALTRVLAAFDIHGFYQAGIVLSTICWTLAFVLYVAVYAPYLLRARIDGKEG